MARSERWLGVEIRHMASLEAVAQERSFGRAATRLGYTQSAVSQHIRALERLVDFRLVERSSGRSIVSLTEAGERLVTHFERILASLRAAEADLTQLARHSNAVLHIGTHQTVSPHLLPEVVKRLSLRWPDLRIVVTDAVFDHDLVRALERGDLDVSFVMLPIDSSDLKTQEIMRDEYVVISRADGILAGRGSPVSAESFREQPFIGYEQCRDAYDIESQLAQRGVTLNVVFRAGESTLITELVAAGLGAALVPRLSVDNRDSRLVTLDLGVDVPPRRIGIAWSGTRRRSESNSMFVALAEQVASELQTAVPYNPTNRRIGNQRVPLDRSAVHAASGDEPG